MPIEVKCQNCQKPYRLKDDMNGKKFKCKACGEIVVAIPEVKAAAPPPAARRKHAAPSKRKKPASAASRRTSTDAPKKRPAKKKRKPDPPVEDYGDPDLDDFDDPIDDYGNDDVWDDGDLYDEPDSPPRKSSKPKRKKKKKSGGGLPIGFNINWMNVAMIFAGGAIFLAGVRETRLAAKSKSVPTEISLADLNSNGYGENIYLTVSGVSCLLEETVVYGDERAGGDISNYDKVWIPCVASGTEGVGRNVHFVVYSQNADTDAEVLSLTSRSTFTGLIVNDVDPLTSSERKLLESGFPGANLRDALILEVDRTPSGSGAVLAYYAGGGLLILGGLAWILFSGGSSTATSRSKSSSGSRRSKGKSRK